MPTETIGNERGPLPWCKISPFHSYKDYTAVGGNVTCTSLRSWSTIHCTVKFLCDGTDLNLVIHAYTVLILNATFGLRLNPDIYSETWHLAVLV